MFRNKLMAAMIILGLVALVGLNACQKQEPPATPAEVEVEQPVDEATPLDVEQTEVIEEEKPAEEVEEEKPAEEAEEEKPAE